MRVAVHQPNYAPWCGYFAKLLASDVFVFFDDVQLPQGRSYVSRTKVAKGRDGEQWLSVPVAKSGNPLINEVAFADDSWPRRHLMTLQHVYARAGHVDEVLDLVTPVYEQAGDNLAEFNEALVRAIAGFLRWDGQFWRSSEHPAGLKADERIAQLVEAVGGDVYLSGSGGQNYQSEETYASRKISLEVRAYEPVPYERSGWPFVPGLSGLDALFHLGAGARDAMRYDGL